MSGNLLEIDLHCREIFLTVNLANNSLEGKEMVVKINEKTSIVINSEQFREIYKYYCTQPQDPFIVNFPIAYYPQLQEFYDIQSKRGYTDVYALERTTNAVGKLITTSIQVHDYLVDDNIISFISLLNLLVNYYIN